MQSSGRQTVVDLALQRRQPRGEQAASRSKALRRLRLGDIAFQSSDARCGALRFSLLLGGVIIVADHRLDAGAARLRLRLSGRASTGIR